MKFLCYTIYSGNPEVKEPMGYCIMGDGRLFSGPTLDYAKHEVLGEYPMAEFLDDCGWILSGEEEALLEPDNQELLAFTLRLKYPDLVEL